MDPATALRKCLPQDEVDAFNQELREALTRAADSLDLAPVVATLNRWRHRPGTRLGEQRTRLLAALGHSLLAEPDSWPTLGTYSSTAESERRHVRGLLQGDWLHILPSTWRQLTRELGLDGSGICHELHQRGELHVPPSRRRAGDWQASPRILGRPTRVYQVALSALP
ncbi:DUF6247 family protein [Pseudonocardia sp. N23]|uniref:DUF6247 family protein n=1 Tax=Pseudonocardia sp. N23 TaxID=1987376 RepID=UPI0035B60C37